MAATSLSDKDLQELKEQAEAQQRRRAPPLAGKDPKRRKTAGGEEEDDDPEGTVARFSYAAADAIAAGSTCLMASCGFNRQRSAAKELLSIVKPLLPEGTQLQMVKVGCRGLAVVRLEPAVPVVPLVGQILDQYPGQMKHTKWIERVIPAETTSLFTSVALEAALTKAATAYLSSLQQQQQQEGGDGDGSSADAASKQPIEFAVLYKSRGVDQQILAEMEKEAVAQQQQHQQQQQQEAAPEAAAGSGKEQQVQQQPQQQEQAGPAAAAGVQGLDRQRVINLAAAVMERCCKDLGGAKVNLSKPQVVVMVEVVPLLRQQTACAVAMLPSSIMSSSHKLKIKPTSASECSKEGERKEGGSQKKQQAAGQGKKGAAA